MKVKRKRYALIACTCCAVLFVALMAVFIIGKAYGGVGSPTRGVRPDEANTDALPPTEEVQAEGPDTGVAPAAPAYGAAVGSPTHGWVPSGDYSWIALDRYFGMKGAEAYNFGPSVYKEGKTAEEYDKEFRELIGGEKPYDVVLGVSAKYYADVVFGKKKATAVRDTEEAEEMINGLIAKYVRSNTRTYEVVIADALLERLDKAKSVKVEQRTIKDQFYQDHFNTLPELDVEVPSVIIMEPIEESVWALVYTFETKSGKELELVLSLDNSYAPVDIGNYLNIKPGKWERRPSSDDK